MEAALGASISIKASVGFSILEWEMKAKLDLSMSGRALNVGIEPRIVVDAKHLEALTKLDMLADPINLKITAGKQLPALKTCKGACTELCVPAVPFVSEAKCTNVCTPDFPCGLKLGSRQGTEWDRFTVSSPFGRSGWNNVFEDKLSLCRIFDKSPPEVGEVRLKQDTHARASVTFGGFNDNETDITATDLVISGSPGGTLLQKSYEGAAVSWSGSLSAAHGASVVACVTVSNACRLRARRCSSPIVWDKKPPSLVNVYTINPFTGSWRGPNSACTGGKKAKWPGYPVTGLNPPRRK